MESSAPENRVSRPLRPPRLTDDSETSSGSGAVAENLHKGNQDQDQEAAVQHVVPGSNQSGNGEDERSVLDPVTWREIWREKLNVKKDSETDINVTMIPEQRQGVSPYPQRVKRQREFYTPDTSQGFTYFPGPQLNDLMSSFVPEASHMVLGCLECPDDPEKRSRETEKGKEPVMAPFEKMDNLTKYELILCLEMKLKEIVANSKKQFSESNGINNGVRFGRKKRGGSDTAKPWAYSEASTGLEKARESVVDSLNEREQGANSRSIAYRPKEVGHRGKSWQTMLNGWDSLEARKMGPMNWIQQRAYSTWKTTWCAYTSSSAVAHPLGGSRMDQGVQKVLDVRFHPGGDPLLVVSCNEPPNELLLYDLESGRGKPLTGLNTQIQAVEFASNGANVVACASNIVKVFDTTSAACLHTFGPGSADGTVGHVKKIHAMTVNRFQPYLVVTTGGEGDNQILLWNVQTGEMASDLNAAYRLQESNLLAMDALQFASDKLLVCGSDSPAGRPSIVQTWDIDARVNVSTYPAHETYMTCLDVNASGSTLLTGSGDGTVGLFDIRSSGAIARLPLPSKWEVTSVSFSSCETYFQASCTGNSTFVWDTRMMPLEAGPRCVERPLPVAQNRAYKALHQLSHGNPMPTAENSFQVPGVVDVGDQGVNDAKWFQNEAILVTASGSGSITMWDPSLGKPCVQHFQSHSRCVNTVALSPKINSFARAVTIKKWFCTRMSESMTRLPSGD